MASYTKDYINRLTKRKKFNRGWYQVMTTAATCEESKSGNVQFVTRETPLRVPGDPSSKVRQSITNYVVTPMMPEGAPDDHEPPDSSVGQTMRFFRAKGIDVPEFPRRGEGGVMTFNGERINKEVADELRGEAVAKLLETAEKFRDNAEELEGYVCYALIDIDGDYNKIKTMRAELPDGAELLPFEQWFSKENKSEDDTGSDTDE